MDTVSPPAHANLITHFFPVRFSSQNKKSSQIFSYIRLALNTYQLNETDFYLADHCGILRITYNARLLQAARRLQAPK
jgi:hypothetical protein